MYILWINLESVVLSFHPLSFYSLLHRCNYRFQGETNIVILVILYIPKSSCSPSPRLSMFSSQTLNKDDINAVWSLLLGMTARICFMVLVKLSSPFTLPYIMSSWPKTCRIQQKRQSKAFTMISISRLLSHPMRTF